MAIERFQLYGYDTRPYFAQKSICSLRHSLCCELKCFIREIATDLKASIGPFVANDESQHKKRFSCYFPIYWTKNSMLLFFFRHFSLWPVIHYLNFHAMDFSDRRDQRSLVLFFFSRLHLLLTPFTGKFSKNIYKINKFTCWIVGVPIIISKRKHRLFPRRCCEFYFLPYQQYLNTNTKNETKN